VCDDAVLLTPPPTAALLLPSPVTYLPCFAAASVTRLQAKKPTWQKARILHLSTQLEDSMFNSKESLVQPTKILQNYNPACESPESFRHFRRA